MSEAWNKMKKAKEDDYFDKQNREALLKLAEAKKNEAQKAKEGQAALKNDKEKKVANE